jgi:nucleoside-diphosphate-sugar epimerase
MGNVRKPPADETTTCNPTNVYERTKWAGEQVALQWGVETGLPVVVARPAWVYGPRCPRTQRLFRAIEKRRFVMFGDGRTLRHPLYVSDAVRGLELCAETDHVAGQLFILAGQAPVTIQELVEMIAEVLDVSPPTAQFPVVLGRMAAIVLQSAFKPLGKQPPFSRRSMDFFLKNNAYDTSKAKRELGFRPMVDLRTGLIKTVHWLRDHAADQSNAQRVEYG